MSQFIFKLPDLGEGTVEAEIVAWHTRPGDLVREDQIIVEVMTDKAAVEVPAPVSGRVVSISGEPGDKLAVGSPLIVFELAATGASADTAPPAAAPAAQSVSTAQPAPGAPMRSRSGITTSSRNTSLKCASPFIWTKGRTCTPGEVMSMANAVMPRCFGTDGSLRANSSPHCE